MNGDKEKVYTKAELLKKLTEKEHSFCHQYIIDWNGARSARDAGYSEDSAREIASENLTKPHIQQYIEFIKDDIEKECGISKIKQVAGLLKIIDDKDAMHSDKIRATSEVNKMLGYNAPDKIDHTTKGESVNVISLGTGKKPE